MNNAANNNSTVTQLHGGATRVSFGQDNTDDTQAQTSLSGTQGGGRVTVRDDGSSTTESFSQHSASQSDVMAEARSNARGILETARTPWGTLGGKLSGDSIVTLPGGMETSMAAAERMGFVMRNASGDYVETGSSVNSREPQHQQQQADSQPQGDQRSAQADLIQLHPEAQQIIQQLIEPLPPHIYEGTLHKVINFGADSLDYQMLAEHMDTTAADAAQRVEFIMSAYKAPADRAVGAIVGAEVDAMYEWAAENAPKAHAEAMTELVFGNDVSKLKALAVKFMKSTNPDDATLKQGGFETRTERDGTRLVRINGTWMALSAAVKQGWV